MRSSEIVNICCLMWSSQFKCQTKAPPELWPYINLKTTHAIQYWATELWMMYNTAKIISTIILVMQYSVSFNSNITDRDRSSQIHKGSVLPRRPHVYIEEEDFWRRIFIHPLDLDLSPRTVWHLLLHFSLWHLLESPIGCELDLSFWSFWASTVYFASA